VENRGKEAAVDNVYANRVYVNKTDADGVVGALVKMERTRMECRFETGERVVFFGKTTKNREIFEENDVGNKLSRNFRFHSGFSSSNSRIVGSKVVC